MIRFTCSNCNRLISVDQKHSGKKGKCPKCGDAVVVPEKSTVIEFACGSCAHRIRVPERRSGKKGACPKCKNPVVVPFLEELRSDGAETVTITCSMCGHVAEVRKSPTDELAECPECGSYVDNSPKSVPSVSEASDVAVPWAVKENIHQESPAKQQASTNVGRRLVILISAVVVIALAMLVIQQQENDANVQKIEILQWYVADKVPSTGGGILGDEYWASEDPHIKFLVVTFKAPSTRIGSGSGKEWQPAIDLKDLKVLLEHDGDKIELFALGAHPILVGAWYWNPGVLHDLTPFHVEAIPVQFGTINGVFDTNEPINITFFVNPTDSWLTEDANLRFQFKDEKPIPLVPSVKRGYQSQTETPGASGHP